jgi:hypothetical protein
MRRLSAFLLVSTILCFARLCMAQAPVPPEPSNNFQKIFPNPTGRNGYEEFVQAGDMVKNSEGNRLYEKAFAQNTSLLTLTVKRTIVSDPAVQQAFALIHAGVRKEVRSPHQNMDDETLLPELASCRAVARLMNVEMYVQFADGKVAPALDTFADGLRFGYLIQTDTVISGLVGIAVDAIMIRMCSDHLEQLSARDCEKLLRITTDWLSLPDPAIKVLESEKQMTMRVLKKYREDASKLKEVFNPGPDASPEEKQQFARVSNALNGNPASVGILFDKAALQIGAQYDQAIENLRRPVWERKEIKRPDENGPNGDAALLVGQMAGIVLSQTSSAYAREQAKMQLLGTHAAVLRYRWENDKLPDSLEELKLGRLLLDPYTGKTLTYKRIDGHHYTLSSVGPYDTGSADTPPSGPRVPIILPVPRP